MDPLTLLEFKQSQTTPILIVVLSSEANMKILPLAANTFQLYRINVNRDELDPDKRSYSSYNDNES